MMSAAITPTAATPEVNLDGTINTSKAQVDFLKLLTEQMRHQNPLDPIKGEDFITQLAQFSQVQSIDKLNSNFSQLLTLQQLTQGASLIGKQIVYLQPGGPPGHGVVDSVTMKSGKLTVTVNGTAVPVERIQGFEAVKT